MPSSVSQTFNFVANAPPPALAITSPVPPAAAVGIPYSFTFTAEGGVTPYTWSISPALPAGFTLDPATGILSGTATTPFAVSETVTVTDSAP